LELQTQVAPVIQVAPELQLPAALSNQDVPEL
jgi:hypothetical protein